MSLTPDARFSLGLVVASLLALGAFLWLGFGPLPSSSLVRPTKYSPRTARDAGTRFEDVTNSVGLGEFSHETEGLHSIQDTIAPGVGLLDLDHDQDLDLVLLGGLGNTTGVSVFLNQLNPEGRLAFVDATAEVGITWRGSAQGLCAGDYDGDGDLDLFITSLGPNLLLRNLSREMGRLLFADVTAETGVSGGEYHYLPGPSPLDQGQVLEGPAPRSSFTAARETAVDDSRLPSPIAEFSTGASFGDMDLDGDLDLYVANYVSFTPDRKVSSTGSLDRDEPLEFRPRPYDAQHDRLYENRGDGSFLEVTAAAGILDQRGKGMAAMFLQVDLDTYPDLYVANDDSLNTYYQNRGQGSAPRFVEKGALLGLADGRSGMGIARGDPDEDGDLDLLVTNWRNEAAALMLCFVTPQEGEVAPQVRFRDRSTIRGVAASTEPLVGWGTVFFDYDNDGDQDCLVVNGATSPDRDDSLTCALERPVLLRNLRGGRFADVTTTAGEPLQRSYAARGLVTGDLDGDLDLDVVLVQNNGPIAVLLNRLEQFSPGLQALQVIPRHLPRRADGIGCRVEVFENNGRLQLQEITSGASYLSQGPLHAHFGLGHARLVDRVQIVWPEDPLRITPQRNVPAGVVPVP